MYNPCAVFRDIQHTLLTGFDPAPPRTELRLGLARLQLGSVRGLRTFHLRGRRLEPHLVDVFAALPDTVRDARFVLVGVSSNVTWGMSRNRFRGFAEAFAPALRKPERARMSFILDLSVAKRKLPEEDFATLRQRAEMGLQVAGPWVGGRGSNADRGLSGGNVILSLVDSGGW